MDYLLLNIVFCNVVLYIYTATYNDQQSLCMLRRMRNIWYSACLPLWSDSVLLWARLGRLYNWVFSIVRGSRGFTTPRSADMNTEYTAPVYSRGRGHFQREKESMSVRNCLRPKHLCFPQLQCKNSADFKTRLDSTFTAVNYKSFLEY